ncbi:MAG TPA: phosphate ABC transporter substrate-binding protein PstS [Pyrinomonadaceae bacterium]|nr:phosphate ABC transporter substrate-binding protein PstS [Pyrinomonadaceae bacterium]
MLIKTILSKKTIGIFLVFIVALGLACSGQPVGQNTRATSTSGGDIRLQGSGASFPKPIYEKWVNEYGKINPNIKIDYQSTGSGAGQKAIIAKTADFGASDDPMSDEDLKDTGLLHIPTVLGAVVLTYNLPALKEPLKLSPEVISDIYLGKIKKWNAEQIKKDNPNVNLPDTEISPVYRADSSGTTAVFTDFLSKTVPEWKEKVSANKQPSWITGVGVGAKGNDGVMGQVKNIPNSIGYVEIAFAKANNLPTALIRNKAGEFIEANLDNIAAAAAGSVAEMPEDMRVQITNADGENAYPISSYTYILVHKDQPDAAKGKALTDFLWWAIHDGEKFTKDLHYASLPDEVVKKAEAKINSMTGGGKPLRQ